MDPNYKWGHVNLGLSLERQVWCPARGGVYTLLFSLSHADTYTATVIHPLSSYPSTHIFAFLLLSPTVTCGFVALCLGFQGNVAEAVESYQKALALDPNFVLALFNLGQAHDRLGNVGAL